MNNRDITPKTGGFGGDLGRGMRQALLIVDAAQLYVDPSAPLYIGSEEPLRANETLLAAARKHGMLVIFTQVAYTKGGFEGGLFFKKVPALKAFEYGEPMSGFTPSLKPNDQELVVTKHYPSAFFGTSLASSLHAAGIDSLLITGFSTSGCIRATALDALCHGFIPLVVDEACGDFNNEAHAANIFDIETKIGEVIDLGEAISIIRSKISN